MADKPLTDEEFTALKDKVSKEEARRQQAAREERETWMKPIQELANGKGMDTVVEKLEVILADPKTASDRNLRMSLDALRGSIENLRLTVPKTVTGDPATPPPAA